MIRGLYTSATGMLALMARQDVISNNLANANTTGFKKDYASIVSFPEALTYESEKKTGAASSEVPIGWLSSGVGIGQTGFIDSTGMIRQTGKASDLAIGGNGFFAVQTPSGEAYTRNGSFMRDARGRLATGDGSLVLGENGPITIQGKEFSVDESGRVLADGKYLDSLKIRGFTKGELEKIGSNIFKAHGLGQSVSDARVKQGYLEGSNVNATSEMVDMVETVRAFEANQRILKTQDELLGKAVNDVGRLA